MHHSSAIHLLAAVAGALVFVIATPATNAQDLREKEKAWKSCEDGYYTGPRKGRRNYTMDKYQWVVTPAFAKRFCMPESMVSDQLQGAEAVAFRMVSGGQDDKCSADISGSVHCRENSTVRLEIYLPQSLNLPSTNPHVKFFYGEYKDSDRLIHSPIQDRSGRGRIPDLEQRKEEETRVPEGRLPRFAKLHDVYDLGHQFRLAFAKGGTSVWPVAPLAEVGFHADWVDGMDVLVLEGRPGLRSGVAAAFHPDTRLAPGTSPGRYAVVMDKRSDPSSYRHRNIETDYAHVIYLPVVFGVLIETSASQSQGSGWFEFQEMFRIPAIDWSTFPRAPQ